MASMSCPARRKYPARTCLSACGSRSASFSTCRVNSAFADVTTSGDGDGPGERPNKDGRLRVLLLRRIMAGVGEVVSEFGDGDDKDDEVVGESVSVRERCTRFGNARGPPGTEGALVISTGRGFGAAEGGGLLSRAGCLLPAPSFLVLEFLPREEKKPPATLDPAESGADDNGDPIMVVEWRKLMAGWTPASAGYGKAGGGTFGVGTVSVSRGDRSVAM
jgi:hypothetical protein